VKNVHVFTSAAANYLPKVRVLFETIKKHHPEWHLHLLLVEEVNSGICTAQDLGAEITLAKDLNIPAWTSWSFCHSIVELCTAVKPFMLEKLLCQEDATAVLYFDPDIALYSRLDDLSSEFEGASLLLTPHQCEPQLDLEAVISQEITSLQRGIYNLGFIGVKADEEGKAFAQWWKQRLYYFCRDDVPNGLFTDQKWIDFVPAFFSSVSVLRSSRFNVAAWNLNRRKLSMNASGNYLVDDQPLGFYHFTGLDSHNHELMLLKFPEQRTTASSLIAGYMGRLKANGEESVKQLWTYGAFSDGKEIQNLHRELYRDDPTLQQQLENPWVGGEEFERLADKARGQKSAFISKGYISGEKPIAFRWILETIYRLCKNPRLTLDFIRAVRRIYNKEGFAGLKRRLLSSQNLFK